MTIQSGFFNSINGDRRYDANWFSAYFASFIGNGVFPNPSTGLQVVEGNNMNIVVKAGKGWINGYFVVNDSDYTLTLDNADGVLKRIDRVVMRLNYLTRQIEIDVKKGIFASNPVVPTLQRDVEAHELALADILINNGALQITRANITDTRLNNDVCGIVHGVVDQVDTTTLYNQYLAFWNDWRTQQVNEFEQFQTDAQTAFDMQTQTNQNAFNQQTTNNQNAFDNQTLMNQQEFDDWFTSIQDVLSGDVAGNLLSLINANTARIEDVEDAVQEVVDSKGQANGIATTDGNGNVPVEQLGNVTELITTDVLAYEQIADITLTENVTGGVTINGLEKYKDLKLYAFLINSTAASGDCYIRVNNDSSANSHYHVNLPGSTSSTGDSYWRLRDGLSQLNASYPANIEIDIKSSSLNKTVYFSGVSGYSNFFKVQGTYKTSNVNQCVESLTIGAGSSTIIAGSRIVLLGVLKDA